MGDKDKRKFHEFLDEFLDEFKLGYKRETSSMSYLPPIGKEVQRLGKKLSSVLKTSRGSGKININTDILYDKVKVMGIDKGKEGYDETVYSTMHTNNKSMPDTEQAIKLLLQSDNRVIIGSRGLGLDKWEDTDIAIHADSLPKELRHAKKIKLKNYVNAPVLGNDYLIRMDGLDILVYEHLECLEAVRRALISTSKLYNKEYLSDKKVRIKCFEDTLRSELSRVKLPAE